MFTRRPVPDLTPEMQAELTRAQVYHQADLLVGAIDTLHGKLL